jgi:hypothetical protein
MSSNNDIIAMNLIRNRYGDEFINLKPANMKWNEYFGYLYNYYKQGISGHKHYWDKDIQSEPIIQYLYESRIPKMWLEKYHKVTDINGADFAISHGNFQVSEWLASKGILPSEKGLSKAVEKGYDKTFVFAINYNIDPNIIASLVVESAKYKHLDFINYVPREIVQSAIYNAMMNEDIPTVEMLTTPIILRFLGYTANDTNIRRQFLKDIPNEEFINLIDNDK